MIVLYYLMYAKTLVMFSFIFVRMLLFFAMLCDYQDFCVNEKKYRRTLTADSGQDKPTNHQTHQEDPSTNLRPQQGQFESVKVDERKRYVRIMHAKTFVHHHCTILCYYSHI